MVKNCGVVNLITQVSTQRVHLTTHDHSDFWSFTTSPQSHTHSPTHPLTQSLSHSVTQSLSHSLTAHTKERKPQETRSPTRPRTLHRSPPRIFRTLCASLHSNRRIFTLYDPLLALYQPRTAPNRCPPPSWSPTTPLTTIAALNESTDLVTCCNTTLLEWICMFLLVYPKLGGSSTGG